MWVRAQVDRDRIVDSASAVGPLFRSQSWPVIASSRYLLSLLRPADIFAHYFDFSISCITCISSNKLALRLIILVRSWLCSKGDRSRHRWVIDAPFFMFIYVPPSPAIPPTTT